MTSMASHIKTETTENTIIRRFLRDAVKAGYSLRVYDGEDWAGERTSLVEEAFQALRTAELDRVYLYREGAEKPFAWVLLIYGNGCDVISDYIDKPEVEAVLKGASAVADGLSRKG